MTNLASTPQLVPPVIPASYCPKGTLAEIFNDLFQQWLTQTVVTGVSAISPADLTEIEAELLSLQNQINALTKFTRTGTSFVGAGDSSVVVGFAAVTTALYDVNVVPISATGAETDPFSWALISGSKTTASFTIRFVDIPATITSFEWTLRQR